MKYTQWNLCKRMLFLKQPSMKMCTAASKNIVLCPGQSSQYIGMMDISNSTSKIQDMVDVANKILGYDIGHICQNGPEELLSRTIHCQPAVVLATLVAYETFKDNIKTTSGCDFDIKAIAGYSVGEISALHISGILSYDEAIILLKERANAMDYACSFIPSGMLIMQGLTLDETKQMCEDLNNSKNDSSHSVSIAIEQYPKAVSLGGSILMLNKVMNREHVLLADKKKVNLAMVNVSGAFHTEYMLPAQEILHNVLDKLNFKQSEVSVYSNVSGLKYDHDSQDIPDLLVRQIVEPVVWNSINENFRNEYGGTDLKFYEIGPGKQLKAILSKINRGFVRRTTNFSL